MYPNSSNLNKLSTSKDVGSNNPVSQIQAIDKAYKENLVLERNKRQHTIRRINQLLIELQECLGGLAHEELDYKDLGETDHHRLEIVKGMSNYELDVQTFQVWRSFNYISDYLEKLRIELDKRAKFSLIPTDGTEWEPASNGRPSIGPRIDARETIDEDGKGYA